MLAFMVALLLAYLAAIAWAVAVQALPLEAVGALALVNLLTFAAYALDKQAALRGQRRISERSLHLWSLAGGWPAAWWAQRLLRHKTVKTSFRRLYGLTVFLHFLLLAAWWQARQA